MDKPFLVHVHLQPGDKQFLLYIADRGGEVEFDKAKVEKNINDRVSLLVKKRILSESELIGRGTTVLYRLTDLGRNLCDQLVS